VSAFQDAQRLYHHLHSGGRLGYWQNRRTVEISLGMSRCQMATAVKTCRDVYAKSIGGYPLSTKVDPVLGGGMIALVRTAKKYRESRMWEYSYNASRVGTCSHNALRAANKWTGSSALKDDVKLLRVAEFMLAYLHHGKHLCTDQQVLNATKRILVLGITEVEPDLEKLFV
jgi:hypothetical protein